MKKYKMVLLDVDGTLAAPNGKISKRNMETIAKVERQGIIVTICTGRNVRRALPITDEMGLKHPFVCMDGAALCDPLQRKIIQGNLLEDWEVKKVLEITAGLPFLWELSDGNNYYKYTAHKDLLSLDMFTVNTLPAFLRNFHEGIRYVTRFRSLYHYLSSCYQIALIARDETLEQVRRPLKVLENIDVRDALWPHYFYLNRKGICKAYGMEMLCRHFGIAPDEVIAMGDGTNDVDMLQAAGLGVAVANAEAPAKAAADEITGSNAEDGVAMILEKYFL